MIEYNQLMYLLWCSRYDSLVLQEKNTDKKWWENSQNVLKYLDVDYRTFNENCIPWVGQSVSIQNISVD